MKLPIYPYVTSNFTLQRVVRLPVATAAAAREALRLLRP